MPALRYVAVRMGVLMGRVSLPFAECPRCNHVWYWLPRRGSGVVGGWWYYCQHCNYSMQRAWLERNHSPLSEHEARTHNGTTGEWKRS